MEEVHRFLGPESDDESFTDFFAELEVSAIYIDLEDFNKVWLQIAYPQTVAFQEKKAFLPMTMEWEEGRWRTNFPFLSGREGCPYLD